MIPFIYNDERFADLQLLHYKVDDFGQLSLNQKLLVYYLSCAALEGRDILFDQNGKYNLQIRSLLESVYLKYRSEKADEEFEALVVYLKRVWFSSGIHHHYSCDKFVPGFSAQYFRTLIDGMHTDELPLHQGQTVEDMCSELFPVIFDPQVMPKRVNKATGDDLVLTSAANYYEGVTQSEVEAFYGAQKANAGDTPVMFGMNSKLVKKDGVCREEVWNVDSQYGPAIRKIIHYLEKALEYVEYEAQKRVIRLLIDFYRTGDLKIFDAYSIQWVAELESPIDFVNGFIESYGDPLGYKASWEGFVNIKDAAATRRTQIISDNAQWFEDHSPVNPAFRKDKVKGVSAKVISAAILAGDLYPASAIGINLPNSNWIRKVHGSKSVTIGNLTEAYSKAALGNGFREEFVYGPAELESLNKYADITGDLHTDLHECLGHGSGKLLPNVDPDALKAYGSTVEEARADLFALYYLADNKMVELGLTPNAEAYKAEYYSYMMNGLLTQMVRIHPGCNIEEDHMRNRQLIARWVLEKGAANKVVELTKRDGKTYLKVNDYEALRQLFGRLLAEIQRIKSEGDYQAAHDLVETYGVKIDAQLHSEVLQRYSALDIAPYKGFVNPVYHLVYNDNHEIQDVTLSYDEHYTEQMLRYSKDYSNLI